MMRNKTVYTLIFLALFLGRGNEGSALDINDLIKGFDPGRIAYSYEAFLTDRKTNQVLDNVQGKMYVLKHTYLDSNSRQINTYDGARSLQIDLNARKAYLKTFRKFKPDTGNPAVLFDLITLLKEKMKRVSSDKTAQGDAVITIELADSYLEELKIALDDKQQLKQLTLKMSADGGTAGRMLIMKDFEQHFNPSVISLNRFLAKSNSAKLAEPYSAYELKNIIL